MWEIMKRIFLNDKDFMKFLSLFCIFISVVLGLVFALKEDKSENFLYLIIAFLSLSFLLMIFNKLKNIKYKNGDKEIDVNIDDESEEANVK